MNVVNAIVLAGGRSSRLGQDKTLVRFNGQGLLARTVHLAQGFCRQVLVVGRDPRSQGIFVPWKLDDEPGLGPIGGIITALRTLKAPCLVLSCDLPFLEGRILEILIQGRDQRPAQAEMTTFRHEKTGYIEPLVAVYELSSLILLESAVRRGVYQINQAVPESSREHLPCNEEMARVFFNVNCPAELRLLREYEMKREKAGPERMQDKML